MDLDAEKYLLRQQAMALRARCDPALGTAMAAHIMRDYRPPAGALIAGFMSLPGEISTTQILASLAEQNFSLCLPYTPKRGEPLKFRAWQPGDILVPGRFGTMHPEGPDVIPDFILIPLLAFDATGNRLGYGGGYYDRTLAQRPNALRLGCAFAAQEFTKIPIGPTDLKLHAIATEQGVKIFSSPYHG